MAALLSLALDTIGGSGPTREKNAGRGAGAFDALLRWAISTW